MLLAVGSPRVLHKGFLVDKSKVYYINVYSNAVMYITYIIICVFFNDMFLFLYNILYIQLSA